MSTEGLSTTFYEGEASQLVLPLLLGVKGNIFINIDTKIFEREYVFNAIIFIEIVTYPFVIW